MKFAAKLELFGKTATGIVVPSEVVEGLGSGKRPAVNVTIRGFTYRTTIAPMSGRYFLPVSALNREGAGIKAGDAISVQVELDLLPREISVPADLQAALDAVPKALSKFESLSYSNKRGHVEQVEGAKTMETRKRRIEKVVAQCSG